MIQKFNPFVSNDYPTTDLRAMSETEWHRRIMFEVINVLQRHFANDPKVYVSGDLLVFSKPGDRRWHLSPDVFVVRGVRKDGERPNYLIWEEGKAPEVVIEITSKSTKKNDLGKKFERYRDEWKVKEYFLFDAYEDYLDPSMQGFRLIDGRFVPIREKDGRLPSRVLGLDLERSGPELRFWNPETGRWILTDAEYAEEQRRNAEEQRRNAEEQKKLAEEQTNIAEEQTKIAEVQRRNAEEQTKRAEAAEAEVARLRALIAGKPNGQANGHAVNGR